MLVISGLHIVLWPHLRVLFVTSMGFKTHQRLINKSLQMRNSLHMLSVFIRQIKLQNSTRANVKIKAVQSLVINVRAFEKKKEKQCFGLHYFLTFHARQRFIKVWTFASQSGDWQAEISTAVSCIVPDCAVRQRILNSKLQFDSSLDDFWR